MDLEVLCEPSYYRKKLSMMKRWFYDNLQELLRLLHIWLKMNVHLRFYKNIYVTAIFKDEYWWMIIRLQLGSTVLTHV